MFTCYVEWQWNSEKWRQARDDNLLTLNLQFAKDWDNVIHLQLCQIVVKIYVSKTHASYLLKDKIQFRYERCRKDARHLLN